MGGEGAFFLYQLNVHTFNCRHRADRGVEGVVAEGWVDGWADSWRIGGRLDTNIYIACLRQVVAFAAKVIIIACLRQGFCIRKPW